jgi:tetratricopeptide (TPR) repeat protein
MSVALSIKTLMVQHETVQLNASIRLTSRISNALMSYQAFLLRTFWPAGLAGHYPFPRQPASWPAVGGAAALLLAVTALAVALRRTRPYLLAGWLWYLGMLVPVIGLVQVGRQAMADRYTYLPQIGLLWMIVFAADEWLAVRPRFRAVIFTLAALLLAALSIVSWRQTGFWRDDFAFMQRALACNEDDSEMHNNMAAAYMDRAVKEAKEDQFAAKADFAAAQPHARRAVELDPDSASAHANLAHILTALGNAGDAVVYARRAVWLDPDRPAFRFTLAAALQADNRQTEAAQQFKEGLRLQSARPGATGIPP